MRSLPLRSRPSLPERVRSLLALVLVCLGLGCIPGQEEEPESLVAGSTERAGQRREWQGVAQRGRERRAVSDSHGVADTAMMRATVTLVNNPPDAVDDTLMVAEDSAATVVDVLTNDSTAPDTGETLTVTTAGTAPNGTVSLMAGVVRYQPPANFHGTTSFTYTVSDGNGGTDTAMVTVTVTPMNDPPDAVDDTLTVAEDSAATVVDVLANDSTAPDTGETLTVTAAGPAANGTVSVMFGMMVRYQPLPDFFGTDTFTYTVSDGNGGTDTAMVTVTVTRVNTPPDAVDDTLTVAEDSAATVVDVLANDSIAPDAGETLTVAAAGPAANGAVTLVGGVVRYQPLPDFSGADTFTYTVSDGNGGSDMAMVTVTVTPRPPATPLVSTPLHGSTTLETTPTYRGTAEPGSTVTVIVDETPVGTPLADGMGNWSFTQPTLLADGPHTVKVTATSLESNTHAFTVDTATSTGGWRPMGTLAATRVWHTATLLPDGKVLVTGGEDADGALPSAELYDPNMGTWRPTGAMATARFGHTETLLGDGTVLVAGGERAGLTLASAELYDPVTGTWRPTGAMATARASHTATRLSDGRILVTGGTSSTGTYVASAEVYDPLEGTWSPAGSLTAARDRHTATRLPDGKVLVVGGFNTGGELATAEVYEPGLGWSPAGSLTTARSSHTATVLSDGKVLITGGYGGGGPLVSVEVYEPGAGWSPAGALITPRRLHTATLLPTGKVLVTGGHGPSGSLVSTEVYDPNTKVWSPTGALATARASHTATRLASGRTLVIGGTSAPGSFLASAEVYGTTGTSSLMAPLTEARTDFMAVLLPGGQVLVVGGSNSNSPLSSAEIYEPSTSEWKPTSGLGMARSSATATLLLTGEVLVAGGKGPGGAGLRALATNMALQSAELFNPESRTWRPTGSLLTPRHAHSAILLSSGKVLITGGLDEKDTVLSTAELYDPMKRAWRETRAMNTPRRAPLVVQLPSGQVLVAGGRDGEGTPLSSAELYDPERDEWTETKPMNAPRASSTAVLLPTGQVLVAGGTDERQILKSSEVYDPKKGQWIPVDDLDTARKSHAALLLPTGNVLVVGGANDSDPLHDVEVFDVSQGEWQVKSRLITPSKDSVTVLLPTGQALVIAGTNSSSRPLKRTELYSEHGDAQTSRPVINPLKSQKPKAFVDVQGKGFVDTAGGPGLVRVQSIHRGELKDVRPQEYSASSLELTLPDIPEGYHLLFVVVNGIAGGRVVHVDGTPPDAPSVKGYTPRPLPALDGTAEPRSTVQVLLGGEAALTAAAPTGTWHLPLAPTLEDGEYTVSATAMDEAGNKSPASTFTFSVDTRAPEPPKVRLERTPTNASKPTLSGMTEPLARITLLVDERQAGQATADTEGYWSITSNTELEDGAHTASATAMDGAFNESLASEKLHFIVDTQPPAIPEVLTPQEGAREASHTPVISGMAEPDSTVTVNLDGKEAGRVTATMEGRWSFTPFTELEDEEHIVSAIAMDKAGNRSLESAPRGFTVGGALRMGGGGLGCAAGSGEPSLVLLGLAALGRFLSRRRSSTAR
jgi:hypothetical protein